MKQALKWDFEKKESFPVEIPDGSSFFEKKIYIRWSNVHSAESL